MNEQQSTPNVIRRYATLGQIAFHTPGLERPGYHQLPLRGTSVNAFILQPMA
jgi:hypothetical protein